MPGCPLASHWGAAHSQPWCEGLSSRNWPRLPRSFRKDSRPGHFTRFIQTHTRGFSVLPGSIPGAGQQDCFPSKHRGSWGQDHWEQPLLVGEAGE